MEGIDKMKSSSTADASVAPTTENVKSRTSRKPRKQGLSNGAKLERTTFRTSREMDFFSEKELVTQTGHDISEWPLVFLKETIDNALDACEGAGIAPTIRITADASGITVADNGPGLPESTLAAAMDFTIRASNREAYVAPDRGAQGNALKTLLPMPYVVDPDHGKLIVIAHGKRHEIRCGANPISQQAAVYDETTSQLTTGTTIRIEWEPLTDADEDVVWPFDDLYPLLDSWGPPIADHFRRLVESFAVFNPHAAIDLDWFGESTTWPATNPAWDKWRPDKPTSPHWYELPDLERLIGAYITYDRDSGSDRLVSDFLAEFDGLSGSQKRSKVLNDTGLKRAMLSEFDLGDQLDSKRSGELLAAMQEHTRPVQPKRLGIIGEEHMRKRLLAMGVQPDSFRYTKKLGSPKSKKSTPESDGKAGFMPWVLESAFGYRGEDADGDRIILAGANWSGAIGNPFRSFGSTGEGLEATLTELQAGAREPIVFVLHLAHPRIEYRDRGKSALVIGGGQ